MKIMIFVLMLVSLASFAAEKISNKKEFRSVIKQIKEIKPEFYLDQIVSLKDQITKYIYYQKGYCNSEFSSVVFSLDNTISIVEGEQATRRLNKVERIYCLKELLKDQIKYSRTLFYSQLKYLKYFNKLELKKINDNNEAYIKKLKDELYGLGIKKKSKRRKKRKRKSKRVKSKK